MKISFDIDNTLIPYSSEFQQDKDVSLLKLISKEELRVGTKKLFQKLKEDGHDIWIYTTSFRSIWKLKLIFAKYGLFPSRFINQEKNQKVLKQNNCYASKNPKLFGIDLHIDDSPGVKLESEKYDFKTLIVSPSNTDWVSAVLEEVKKIELNFDWQFEQLIITLIALRSNFDKQIEIYGIGDSTSEMVEDFYTYFDLQKKNWKQFKYLSSENLGKLDELKSLLDDICNDKDCQFWVNPDLYKNTEIIKNLSNEILKLSGNENKYLEIHHEIESYRINNINSQKTKIILR